MNNENSNEKKDVCSKMIFNSEQKNLCESNIIFTSNGGYVTYLIPKSIANIVEYKPYRKFFKMLANIEKRELNEKLPFYVGLDYMTIESFMLYIQSNGYKALEEKIGKYIFYLIADISLQRQLYKPREIRDNYITNNDLENLKEYYSSNNDTVTKSLIKNYSSLYLYEVLYKDKEPYSILENIREAILNLSNPLLKEFARNLWISFENTLVKLSSEKSRDDLFYEIIYINNNLDKFTESKIKQVKNYDIDYIYSLIS